MSKVVRLGTKVVGRTIEVWFGDGLHAEESFFLSLELAEQLLQHLSVDVDTLYNQLENIQGV